METCNACREVITWLQTLSAVLAMLCTSLSLLAGYLTYELRRATATKAG